MLCTVIPNLPLYEVDASYVELRRWVEQRPTCLHSWFPWPFLQDELVRLIHLTALLPLPPKKWRLGL